MSSSPRQGLAYAKLAILIFTKARPRQSWRGLALVGCIDLTYTSASVLFLVLFRFPQNDLLELLTHSPASLTRE